MELVGVEDAAGGRNVTAVGSGVTRRPTAQCFIHLQGVREGDRRVEGTRPGDAAERAAVGLVEDALNSMPLELRVGSSLSSTRHPTRRLPLTCRETRRAQAGAPRCTAWAWS